VINNINGILNNRDYQNWCNGDLCCNWPHGQTKWDKRTSMLQPCSSFSISISIPKTTNGICCRFI